jgi:hypothetical protein
MAAAPSLGDLYTETLQLNNENKISSKNAFDLKLIEHMDKIVDTFMSGGKVRVEDDGSSRLSVGANAKGEPDEEHRFHEASCTIEASAKIYACRVDVVHSNTYKVLGGLSMQEFEEEGAVGEDGKPGGAKRRRIVGVNTLERNEANITQTHIDADEQNDPMFRRMAQAFDAGGAKGLLLSHLPVAEDMSLTFNQDVPMTKAGMIAKDLFREGPQEFPVTELGVGDPTEFLEKLKGARCLPELDTYRRQLVGNKEDTYELPKALREVLDCGIIGESAPALAHDDLTAPIADAPGMDNDDGLPDLADVGGDMGGMDAAGPAWDGDCGAVVAAGPLADELGAQVVHSMPGTVNVDGGKEAFDELFSKFCGAGLNQFAYFDQCWAPLAREKDGKGVLTDGRELGADGQLVQMLGGKGEKGEKASKKPLFDLEGLEQAAKRIETEPSCRHQLNEKAAQWQLFKDVPPYMMDRITMPSWPTATKNNFTCLGLRHNLLLRLQKRPPPATEGPHSFDELYSTVIIQNHEEYPWLAAASRRANSNHVDNNDDIVCGEHEMYLGEEGGADDFDAHGLPAHLDVDPQDLFLHPDDTVIPECDDMPEDNDFGMGGGMDLDFVDKPSTCGSTDIGYSRNSKFVDVKLVKKHLWDCINDELVSAKAADKELMESSFQGLVTRTLGKLPKSECENLSIQVCFICALHLCNEKGVEIVTDPDKPLLDFLVTGKP